MYKRGMIAVTIALIIASVGAITVWANNFKADKLVQASGASPFTGCTTDDLAGQISRGGVNYANSEVEPWLDINPTDAKNMVGAWQQDRWSNGGARGLVAGVSKNGGKNWSRVVIPNITKCSGAGDYERASDPWVTFAPNGDLYHISLSFNDSNTRNAVLVNKSTDGGSTWSNPVELIRDTAPTVFNDKESITADPTDSNYVYAIWDRLVFPSEQARGRSPERALGYRGPTWFAQTTDGGNSWESARMIYDPGEVNQTIGNQIVVRPNGDLINGFNLIFNFKNAHKVRGMNVAVIRSGDKGATWSQPVIIDKLRTVGVTDPESGADVRTGDIIPEIAVDPNNGNLYMVWQDARFSGFDEVAFSMSTDGGNNWSPTVKINKTPGGIGANGQAFTPSVHVSADGTVAVTYYDFRNNDGDPELETDYFVIHCHSNCADPNSWGNEVRLTDASFDMRQAPFARGFFVGDYEGLASAGNDFFAFFSQSHASDPSSVFIRRVGP